MGELDAAVRQLGDVETWAAAIARDVATVSRTLDKAAANAGGATAQQR